MCSKKNRGGEVQKRVGNFVSMLFSNHNGSRKVAAQTQPIHLPLDPQQDLSRGAEKKCKGYAVWHDDKPGIIPGCPGWQGCT